MISIHFIRILPFPAMISLLVSSKTLVFYLYCVIMVHLYISQYYCHSYCHRTKKEVAWLPCQKLHFFPTSSKYNKVSKIYNFLLTRKTRQGIGVKFFIFISDIDLLVSKVEFFWLKQNKFEHRYIDGCRG